jgi:hypothetical protein
MTALVLVAFGCCTTELPHSRYSFDKEINELKSAYADLLSRRECINRTKTLEGSLAGNMKRGLQKHEEQELEFARDRWEFLQHIGRHFKAAGHRYLQRHPKRM